MKKNALRLMAVTCATLLFALISSQLSFSAQKTFVIGVSAPLSGPAAVRGKYIKDGAEFAAEQINKAGGAGGAKLELRFEDNEGNPTKTASTVEKLLKKDDVKALLVADSTGTIASMPLVEKAKVPMFSTAFSPELTNKGNKYVFRSTVCDSISGAQVMDFVTKELKYKKIAIMSSDGDYGQGGAVAAAKELQKMGNPAIVNELFKESDRDFSSQLLKVQRSGAQVLYIHSLDPSAALVTKQAREMGMTIPIVGVTGLASEQYRDLAGADNVEGVYVLVAFAASNPDPAVQKFVKDFQAFAHYMPDHNVARAEAAILLIADAVKKVGPDDSAKVAEAIHHLKNVKTPGGTFTFDATGEGLHQNLLGQWRKGKFVFLRKM